MSQIERLPEIITQEIDKENRFHRLSSEAQRAFVDYVETASAFFCDQSEANFDNMYNPVGRVQTYGVADAALACTLRVVSRLEGTNVRGK